MSRGCLQVLARDVAYELIPTIQRRSLHARLAQVTLQCSSCLLHRI